MLNNKKRGIALPRLTQIILVLLFFIVALVIAPSFLNWSGLKSKEEVCKFTIGAGQFTKVGSFSVIREKCPQSMIRIYNDKITKDDKPLPFKFKEGEKTKVQITFKDNLPEEFVYKTLSDEMVNCWDKFGHGKDIFEANLLTTNKNCARCALVTFDGSAVNSGSLGSLNRLAEFMSTNTIKGTEETYYDHLYMNAISNKHNVNLLVMGEEMSDSDEKDLPYYNPQSLVIDQSTSIIPSVTNTYQIIYFVWSSQNIVQILDQLGLSAKFDVPSHVFLVPSDQITTYLCENFMN
ncbi:hypothetical protein J4434_06175 [Candidatus Woesearchaeota archaeon]|nr:hypothetical protein [Candidatus Woesearchaeota archaeon]